MGELSLPLIVDIILAGMVIGPLIAPYLAASEFFLLPQIANIIYFVSNHVCPQPDMGLQLASPFTMAVCMRCYGTVTGLLVTRILYSTTRGKGFYWLTQYGWYGAALSSILMMAYGLELAAQVLDFWNFNNYVVTLFGLITGLGWGLLAMPVLHHRTKMI
jgi:uncharacterized membrane protein